MPKRKHKSEETKLQKNKNFMMVWYNPAPTSTFQVSLRNSLYFIQDYSRIIFSSSQSKIQLVLHGITNQNINPSQNHWLTIQFPGLDSLSPSFNPQLKLVKVQKKKSALEPKAPLISKKKFDEACRILEEAFQLKS